MLFLVPHALLSAYISQLESRNVAMAGHAWWHHDSTLVDGGWACEERCKQVTPWQDGAATSQAQQARQGR